MTDERTIFFLFYEGNLNTQDFAYLEFVKNQLGLRRNMPVFAKCNVYISAIQLFLCTGMFLYQNKLYIFPIVRLAIFLYWNPYYMVKHGETFYGRFKANSFTAIRSKAVFLLQFLFVLFIVFSLKCCFVMSFCVFQILFGPLGGCVP